MMTEIKALFVVVALFLLLLGGSVLNIDINAGDSSNDAWESTKELVEKSIKSIEFY